MDRFREEIVSAARWAARLMPLPKGTLADRTVTGEALGDFARIARLRYQDRFIETIEAEGRRSDPDADHFLVRFGTEVDGERVEFTMDIGEECVRGKMGVSGPWICVLGSPAEDDRLVLLPLREVPPIPDEGPVVPNL
jgi:hypothetical protein